MVMWWYALWDVCIYYLLMLISLLVWSWGVCIWDTWLNHFWVIDQLYLDYFPIALMGLKCLFWSWWCHVVTYLTWPFWSLWSILSWVTFRLLVENQWVLWFTLGCFSVSHGGLMWLLWVIFWFLLVTCIRLRWLLICDFMSLG